MDKIFVSYSHSVVYAEGEKVMFCGSCQFRALLEAPDARKNSAWREHVSKIDGVIVRVQALFEHAHEAANDVARLVREHKPYCNIHGRRDAKGGPIRCVTEGKNFDNAADCARYYGFSPATLSNHLNKRPGYVTIRGMTFERL